MAVIGEFGDPPEPEHRTERAARKKRRSGRTTFNDCVAEFARQSRRVGHREFNIGIVRKSISTLHKEHGLEYERIKETIETFFTRFEQKARSADNIGAVFRHYLPQLLRAEDQAADAYGETQEDWEELWEREQEKKRRVREALLGREE